MICKPGFYDKFSCIGGACEFTCCMEWKIYVDDKTAETWKHTGIPAASVKRNRYGQAKDNLLKVTEFKEGSRVIALDSHKKCPLLNEEGLCDLVIEQGDEMLSETCQVFPREKHVFADRTELSLMPCCPAVIDLFAGEEFPGILEQAGPKDRRSEIVEKQQAGPKDRQRFAGKHEQVRNYLMNLNYSEGKNLGETLSASFFLLGQFEQNDTLTVEEADSYKDEILSMIRKWDFDPEDVLMENLELFLDLSENYRKQGIYTRYLEETAVQAEEILKAYEPEVWIEKNEAEFQPLWSSYEQLLKNWMYYELYADLLNVDSSFSDMIVHLQWIAMEYVFIRTQCYLHFIRQHELTYEDVKTSIVLASRMMGYDEEDIFEYMENSFESLYWDIGYFGMITAEPIGE